MDEVVTFCSDAGLGFEVDSGRRIAADFCPNASLEGAAEEWPPGPDDRYPRVWFDPDMIDFRPEAGRSGDEGLWGRCYFAHQVGPNKPGEVWQELWVDGQKRAQIIYDSALRNDEDQLALDVSNQHASRLAELSAGKHTLDIWIYRQGEEAETPEPLAAGELTVRK